MFLEMHLGSLLIEKKFVDFSWCETMMEREEHLKFCVERMRHKNVAKIAYSREEPVFYLNNISSKMNEVEVDFINLNTSKNETP